MECLHGELDVISDYKWSDWLLLPSEESRAPVPLLSPSYHSNANQNVTALHALACFTCGECSSACPIACERSVFDPRSLFRMFNLGLMDELLHNPSIWLCLDCGRCTRACSQLVDGLGIIRFVKQQAIDKGIVDHAFFTLLEQASRLVLQRWVKEVDALFEFTGLARSPQTGEEKGFASTCVDFQLLR